MPDRRFVINSVYRQNLVSSLSSGSADWERRFSSPKPATKLHFQLKGVWNPIHDTQPPTIASLSRRHP